MEYYVGQRLRIRRDLSTEHDRSPGLMHDMIQARGLLCTVRRVRSYDSEVQLEVRIDGEDNQNYNWHPSWFEPPHDLEESEEL